MPSVSVRAVAAVAAGGISLACILTNLYFWNAPPQFETIAERLVIAWIAALATSVILATLTPKERASDRRLKQVAFGVAAANLLVLAFMQL